MIVRAIQEKKEAKRQAQYGQSGPSAVIGSQAPSQNSGYGYTDVLAREEGDKKERGLIDARNTGLHRENAPPPSYEMSEKIEKTMKV
jgi:hypothetical protein